MGLWLLLWTVPTSEYFIICLTFLLLSIHIRNYSHLLFEQYSILSSLLLLSLVCQLP